MTDKKSNDSRRSLLKSIAAGSGAVVAGNAMPQSWSKPVIDAVVLPVHAATTDDGSLPDDGTTPAPTTPGPCNIEGIYCVELHSGLTDIEITVDDAGRVDVELTEDSLTYTGNGNTLNGSGGGSFSAVCTLANGSGDLFFVNGTVVCNATAIDGYYERDDSTPDNPYTATQGACL